jgi:hypothetical protein
MLLFNILYSFCGSCLDLFLAGTLALPQRGKAASFGFAQDAALLTEIQGLRSVFAPRSARVPFSRATVPARGSNAPLGIKSSHPQK